MAKIDCHLIKVGQRLDDVVVEVLIAVVLSDGVGNFVVELFLVSTLSKLFFSFTDDVTK
jgi:uncharacterized membrane protein YwzB